MTVRTGDAPNLDFLGGTGTYGTASVVTVSEAVVQPDKQ
jgi:hypothetical protein